jgi:hypothetical protein
MPGPLYNSIFRVLFFFIIIKTNENETINQP